MKFILSLVSLALFVALSQAQCRGLPLLRPNCFGGRMDGHNRWRQCPSNANDNMWYFDSSSRSCRQMRYLGCGGNNNRFCTRSACVERCGRVRT